MWPDIEPEWIRNSARWPSRAFPRASNSTTPRRGISITATFTAPGRERTASASFSRTSPGAAGGGRPPESEKKYRTLVETSQDLIYTTDSKGFLTYVNPALEKILGYDKDGLQGQPFSRIAAPEFLDMARDIFRRAMRGERILVYEGTLVGKGGTRIVVEFNTTTLLDAEGKPSGRYAIGRDVTERGKMEQALRESEEKFRLLVNQLPDVIFAINGSMDGLHVSPAVEKVLGYRPDELTGRNIMDLNLLVPEYMKMALSHVNDIMQGHVVSSSVFEILDRNGGIRMAEVSGAPLLKEDRVVAVIAVARDITDRVRSENERATLERQRYQSQKMESIGTLAGGIAHDFNNLLMSMQGNTSMMMEDLDPSHPHREYLKSIEIQIRSAANLTRQLLGFAREGLYDAKPVNMNEIMENTAFVFARTRKEIRLHRTYATDLWTVEADADQMGQVFMNLFVNAGQAMPEGGDLHLETENVLLDEAYAKPHGTAPGRYVKISVTDTGVGMDEKTMQRIFEPFFTTKERGKGTGLGLSMVYGITKGHKGFITVSSKPGRGATFSVYLPASEREIAAGASIPPGIILGTGTILLVDDEIQVLQVTQRMLEHLGYDVVAAESGERAVDLYRERKESIDLVLLDMIMPGMSGEKVFQILREMNPEVRVILSSGYDLNGQAMNIVHGGCDGFLQKPVSLDGLSRKIHEVLEGKGGN